MQTLEPQFRKGRDEGETTYVGSVRGLSPGPEIHDQGRTSTLKLSPLMAVSAQGRQIVCNAEYLGVWPLLIDGL